MAPRSRLVGPGENKNRDAGSAVSEIFSDNGSDSDLELGSEDSDDDDDLGDDSFDDEDQPALQRADCEARP
jgi:hypothetical protein